MSLEILWVLFTMNKGYRDTIDEMSNLNALWIKASVKCVNVTTIIFFINCDSDFDMRGPVNPFYSIIEQCTHFYICFSKFLK